LEGVQKGGGGGWAKLDFSYFCLTRFQLPNKNLKMPL